MSWRSAIGHLLASQSELEADDERGEAARQGTQPVSACVPRRRTTVSGVLRSVTYRAGGQAPALVAELYDGSGSIDLIWLGRRDIAGIEPGRRLAVEGMVSEAEATRSRVAIYNPTYRLLAPAEGR